MTRTRAKEAEQRHKGRKTGKDHANEQWLRNARRNGCTIRNIISKRNTTSDTVESHVAGMGTGPRTGMGTGTEAKNGK